MAASEERSISYTEALGFCDQRRFTIQTNSFSLLNKSEILSKSSIARIISHFGSIFQRSRIMILLTDTTVLSCSVTLQVFDSQRNETLFLNFDVSNNDLEFNSIRSMTRGFGGKALVSLYNFAKDLELRKIFFLPQDIEAEQFYFYMDFATRVNNSRWTLELP